MTRPPPLWSGSELPKQLTDALASADADAASDEAMARVKARLGAAIGPAFDVAPPLRPQARVEPAAPAARFLTPGKWIGFGAVLAIGLGMLAIGAPVEPAAERRAPPTAAAAGAALKELAPPTDAEPVVDPLPTEPVPEPQPSAAVDLVAGKPRADKRTQRSVQRAASPEPGLAEELRQLNQIRQQLRVSPARALVEADAHARLFAHGTLGPERELLRVDALLRLGRNAEAHVLAQRMLSAPEGHPYRAQLEQLLAGH